MANIEFVDRDFGHVRVPVYRKIKFKQVSFVNISRKYNEYRLNRMKSQLINNKEKLVSMEFNSSQFEPGTPLAETDATVLKKTTAILRLESKINFLETGNYLTEDFVDSHAIKLKDKMMQNLQKNRMSLYTIKPEIKEKIVAEEERNQEEAKFAMQEIKPQEPKENPTQHEEAGDNVSNENGIVDMQTTNINRTDEKSLKEQEEIAETVRNIMTDSSSESQHFESNNANDLVPKSVPNTQENENSIEEPVKDTVEDAPKMTTLISAEELAETINNEMNKIKVSKNESSPARVEKFITNESENQMTDSFMPITLEETAPDISSIMPDTEDEPENDNGVSVNDISSEDNDIPGLEPFKEYEQRKPPIMNMPRKALTAIAEPKKYIFEPLPIPKIKDSFIEQAKIEQEKRAIKETTIVVPERPSANSIDSYRNTIQMSEDVQEYLNKATELSKDLQDIGDKVSEVEESIQQTDQRYQNTKNQLKDFVDSLEKKCNDKYQKLQEMCQVQQRKEDEILAMENFMSIGL